MKKNQDLFSCCCKCRFLSWNFEAFFKKILNFKRDCNLHQQVRFLASGFFLVTSII